MASSALAVVIADFDQFSGITALLYHLNGIFEVPGADLRVRLA